MNNAADNCIGHNKSRIHRLARYLFMSANRDGVNDCSEIRGLAETSNRKPQVYDELVRKRDLSSIEKPSTEKRDETANRRKIVNMGLSNLDHATEWFS